MLHIRPTFEKISKALFLSAVILMPALCAGSSSGEDEKEPFDPGKKIISSVQDMHELHIGDFSVYLPIIIFSEGSFHAFSSSHLYHNKLKAIQPVSGEKLKYYEHDGFVMVDEKIYAAGVDGGLTFDPESGEILNARPLDFSITRDVFGIFVTIAILLFVFLSVARAYTKRPGKAPSGLQNFMEAMILFVRDDIAVPSIGAKHANKFLPFLLSIFFFIWIANMLGLIPFIGKYNITGSLSITLVLAGLVFIITTLNGNRHYWSHILWPAGVPLPIKFILVPIEFLGIFIKPAVLMVRLSANMTAGAIIILSLVSLVFIFGETSPGVGYAVGVGSTLFMIFILFLKLLVAFLQAFVFTLLAALYFGDAVQEAHH